MAWCRARVATVTLTRRRSRSVLLLEFEVLDGEHKGRKAKDYIEPENVYQECHYAALVGALGGASPKVDDTLEIKLDGPSVDLRVSFKGYRRSSQ